MLANGCSCSVPAVHPQTWDRKNASIKKQWYIHYRFYDPAFKGTDKYPFAVVVKGMNSYHSLQERQGATKVLLADINDLLTKYDYNPITETSTTPVDKTLTDTEYIISPDTPMIKAMLAAFERLDSSAETKINIRSVMKYFKPASDQLRFSDIEIKNVRRRHIKLILAQVGKNKKDKWSANNYNHYRAHLRMIFKELVELDTIDANPVADLSKQKQLHKMRTILSDDQILLLNTQLRADNFRFWRMAHIFANSGSRTTELLEVKKKDVDLKRQMIKYTVWKGRQAREVERPIKTSVIHFWEQVYTEATDGEQYLFSEGLMPGPTVIRREQITRRWRLWVKNRVDDNGRKIYGENVPDWYSLKHLNTDKMEAIYGAGVAATLNQHSAAMVNNVYAVGKKGRENELIKKSKNSLMVLEIKKPA